MTAPLKTDGEFTSQPAEVWGNEMVAEPVSHSWAEDVPVPAPVSGGAAQAVSYNTSDDWAAQVSRLQAEQYMLALLHLLQELRCIQSWHPFGIYCQFSLCKSACCVGEFKCCLTATMQALHLQKIFIDAPQG